MKREIKFKFWLGHTQKMTHEYQLIDMCHKEWDITDDIIPLEFTGLKDKNGKDIYEGYILKIRFVELTWQTHTGDNIPCGSYTEPDETFIREYLYSVVFKDGYFGLDTTNEEPPFRAFEGEMVQTYTMDWWYLPAFDGMDDDYFSSDGFDSIDELKKTLGCEVIGNIYENPELLVPKI